MEKIALYLCLFVLSLDHVGSVNGSAQMDIVLLLDSSDDVRSQSFEKEKRFLTAFVNQVFDSNTRISIFTFGDGAYSAFTLDAYSNIRDLKQAILYLWFTVGKGNISPAVNTTLNEAFTGQLEDRECAARIMVIVTHSAIKDSSLTAYFRERLERMRVRTLILNMVGSKAEQDFVTMANSSSRVYSISDFDALEASVPTVISKIKSDQPNTGCGILSPWESWTSCSVTCGNGLNFRTRYCVKNEESDKDCEGETTENMPCQFPECTDPLDGSWSMWQEWGKCSKTCQKGQQQRIRLCDNPAPRNGGKQCVGKTTDSRDCADWNCPDCNKKCPPGARLSTSCEVCECSAVTLFGKVMDNRNTTVNKAEIFVESRRYLPIATSNSLGVFRANGLCMVNETVFVQAKGWESKRFMPKELNSTHWTLTNPRLDKQVLAVFTMQPSDKVRMVGQNFSLCCRAIGYPAPTSYKWYKNNIEMEGVGVNGTLIMKNLEKSDTGTYWCSSETEAGVSLSEKVDVSIYDKANDTCGVPKPKLQALPNGCFVTGDTSKNNTIDIGNCGKALCVKSSLHDNGSCSDWWSHHCCNPKDTEVVDVTCDGFNYKTSRVKSCECKLCVYKTMIFGRAIGRQNGTDVPFKLGQIFINGKPFARTNAAGFFKFEIPKEVKRVVATFHDDYNEIFEDTTKIIQAKPGGEVFVSVVIPIKPAPIAFEAENGTEVHLGASENTVPVGSIEIAPNSVVTEDGEPHSGPVKATFSFMDPRNRDDLEAANGDFESEGPNGEKVPLVTYGMFQIGIKDNAGKSLKINKPIKYSVDASMFDIPVDKFNTSDSYLWSYDMNKGIWTKLAKVMYENSGSGRRKLLAAGRFVAEFEDPSIPLIEQVTTTTSKVPTGRLIPNYNVNHDKWLPEYDYVTRRDVKEGSCYISVSVYKNLSLLEPYDGNDIEIKAYIKDKDDKNAPYVGTNSIRLLKEGHACVPVFCNKYVELHVNRLKERLYAAEHYLPNPYYVKRTIDNEVQFESTNFGTSLNCNALPYLKPNSICEGPMYPKLDEGIVGSCDNVKTDDNSFQFKFAPFTSPPFLNQIAGKGVFDKKISWYPVSPDKATFRTCFMKVRIDIQKTYDIKVFAKSRLHVITGDEFGSAFVGPVPDSRTDDENVRCACVEFRCPGYIKDGNKELFDRNTSVEVLLTSANSSMKCKISKVNRRLDISNIQDPKRGDIGFRFTAEAGRNYGRNYGVYINDNTREEVRRVCESGIDQGPKADGLIDPKLNTAVTFDCM